MFRITTFSLALLISQNLFAQSEQVKSFQASGMVQLKQMVIKHAKKDSAEGCPASGSEDVTLNFSKSTTVGDMEDALKEANTAIDKSAKNLLKESRKCGSCQQLSVVSQASIISPEIDSTVSSSIQQRCMKYPAVQFSKKFASIEEGQTFLVEAFKKNNDEGEKMYEACPGDCSFYINLATTNLAAGKKLINIVVQCGPPKVSEGIGGLDSPYKVSGKLIHEWTCSQASK